VIKMTIKFYLINTVYRVIKKSLCTWWLQYRKLQVMFKVSPASLQTFIVTPNCVLEDCVQYSTVHIPSVFCDGQLQVINCVGIVRQVHRDFLSTLYLLHTELTHVTLHCRWLNSRWCHWNFSLT
jgi:hypothetical protein